MVPGVSQTRETSPRIESTPANPEVTAHKHCTSNRVEVMASEQCGCFSCLRIFSPGEIEEWLSEPNPEEGTALCPYCSVDSIIGSSSGYPITPVFLTAMQSYWF
jgi:hypothetical protein